MCSSDLGYVATASPGGMNCTTAGPAACTITGLANGNTYSITVVAETTSGDSGASAPATVTLTTARPPTIPKIRTVLVRTGAYVRRTIQATGYPAPALTESGPLPDGLSFTGTGHGTAVLAGTPAARSTGRYRVTIIATNASGRASRNFTIIVLRGRHRRRPSRPGWASPR